MNQFYVTGSGVYDVGWFSYLLTKSSTWPILNPPIVQDDYFRTHFSLFYYASSFIYQFIDSAISPALYFSMFIGSMYGIISLATFQIGTYLLPNKKVGWLVVLLVASISTPLNGAALGLVGFPHVEIAIPALILLFLALYFTDKKTGSFFVLLALLSIREDAGFHLAGLLITLLISQYLITKKHKQLPVDLLAVVLIALLFSICAMFIQKTYFPGDNALQRVYLGNPPFTHLSVDFFVEAAKFLILFREYLYIPLLFISIMAYYNRNIFLVSTLLASLPWLLLSFIAVNNMPRELSNYYAFPLITILAWPIYAFVINLQINSVKKIYYAQLAITVLMVTGASIFLFPNNLGNSDPAPWKWFTFEYKQYVSNTEALIEYNALNKADFGRILYDDSVATLTISELARREYAALNRFRVEQLVDVESMIFTIPHRIPISPDDISNVVSKVIADNQLEHICKVENTYIVVATNKQLPHLFENDLLSCMTDLLPLLTDLTVIEDVLPETAIVINHAFADGIELAAYQIENNGSHLHTGQFVDIILYWRAIGNPAQRSDPAFVLSMMDDTTGAVLTQFSTWLDPTFAPITWQTDKLYTMAATLQMPKDELPTEVVLWVSTLPDRLTGIPLAAFVTAGNTVQLDSIVATAQAQAALFGEDIQLIGHEVTIGEGLLTVDLVWEAIGPPSADYTVFIHLLNKDGQLVAQYDRRVGGQQYPSSTWQTGDYYQDSFPMLIPDSAEIGTYQLSIGMYQWPSLDPILITDTNGNTLNNLILSEVEINGK